MARPVQVTGAQPAGRPMGVARMASRVPNLKDGIGGSLFHGPNGGGLRLQQVRVPLMGPGPLPQVRLGQAPTAPEAVRDLGGRGWIPPEGFPPQGTAVPDNQGRPRAWGKLKKLEAQQLLLELNAVLERMKDAQVPPGILEKVRDKLAQFVTTAGPLEEIEMTQEEIMAVDAALASFEAQEATASERPAYAKIALAVGAGALVLWLLS